MSDEPIEVTYMVCEGKTCDSSMLLLAINRRDMRMCGVCPVCRSVFNLQDVDLSEPDLFYLAKTLDKAKE